MVPEALAPDFASLSALLDTYDYAAIPCRASDTPEDWSSDDAGDQATAAKACPPCPAIDQCRAYGLAHRKEVGVYGGLTEKERRAST